MNLDATITNLVQRGETITLQALGGIDNIPDATSASPLFPYVAHAFVSDWEHLDGDRRARARWASSLRPSPTAAAASL